MNRARARHKSFLSFFWTHCVLDLRSALRKAALMAGNRLSVVVLCAQEILLSIVKKSRREQDQDRKDVMLREDATRPALSVSVVLVLDWL